MSHQNLHHQSVFLPLEMVEALEREHARLDRTTSWLVQRCVRGALDEIRALPSVPKCVYQSAMEKHGIWIDLLEQIDSEAKRLKRTRSWVLARCVAEGLRGVRGLPTMQPLDVSDRSEVLG